MRLFAFVLAAAVFWSGAAASETSALRKALENYRSESGQIDWAKARQEVEKEEQAEKRAAGPAKPAKPPAPKVAFLLRQNFSDIHLFEDPTKVADAKGAAFSWSDDRIADDQAWSVSGLVATAYSIPVSFAKAPGETALMGVSLIPYAKLDREAHSKLTKKNSDVRTLGGSLEFGFDTKFAEEDHAQNYFRFAASSVDDRVADTQYVHSSAEWIPVYAFSKNVCIGFSCGAIPVSRLGSGPQLIYKFSPEIKAIYDRKGEGGGPLPFSSRSESFRIGPEATLLMKLYGPQTVIWKDYIDLSKFLFKTTYYWNVETTSDQDFYLLDTSLTYNIGDGHLGLTLSHQNGYIEETGVRTDLTKLSLTGKF